MTNTDFRNPLYLQTKMEYIRRYSHDVLFQFPKKERYLLCRQIEDCIERIIREIIRFQKRYYKKTKYQSSQVEVQRHFLEISTWPSYKEGRGLQSGVLFRLLQAL